MNAPNRLTLLRIALTVVMAAALTTPGLAFGRSLALLMFMAAAVTDYWDGRLARAGHGVTVFGKFMDPLADKILVCAAFVSFVAMDEVVPAWIVIIIISREFLVTGLRLIAADEGRVVAAGRWGKQKTAYQVVAIVVIIGGFALREDLLPAVVGSARVLALYDRAFKGVTFGLSLLVAVLTVISGAIYFWQHRDLVWRHSS